MVVAGSNCIVWNNCEGIVETLVEMGKDESKVEDVEEGEISDTASVEEITEEDFKKQESTTATNTVSLKPKAGSRVWTMQDLYQYQVSRGYASSLYNLAWAQAVQNKPLNDIFVMEAEVDPDEKSKQSFALSNSNSKGIDEMAIDDDNADVKVVVVDVDKEEGELEEGEIDLDSESVDKGAAKNEAVLCNASVNVESSESVTDKRVTSILEALESATAIEAEK